jgi:hypothetical protein
MDVNRLGRGEMVAAASAVLLFIVMFLGWFGIDQEDAADISIENAQDLAGFVEVGDTSLSLNAWQSFGFIDIILLLTIVVAVGVAVMAASSQSVNMPVAGSALVCGLGALATLLILFRILVTPFDLGREVFVFVGLILAAGIAYGGFLAMQEEGTSFREQGDRLQQRGPGDPPPPAAGGGPPPAV